MKSKTWLVFGTALLCTAFTSASYSVDVQSLKHKFLKPPVIKEPLLNQNNKHRTELGKILFFDPRLSGSNWISCATCHNPALGWSDGLPTAIGDGQKVLPRATPTILNSAYNFLQMWDGRAHSLEEQALGPVEAKGEMNQDLDELVKELNAVPGYKKLFHDAYPGRGITKETIAQALASFERSIVTTEPAPFDRWVIGEEEAISDKAKRGFELFVGKAECDTCHDGYNFTDDGFHNIGLKSDDPGRHNIKPVKVTQGAFKTPTLRNITQTAPYMHNGAYATLEKVVDHYIEGGVDKSNLSPNMKKAKLNRAEKAELLAFLKTLTSPPREITYPELPK